MQRGSIEWEQTKGGRRVMDLYRQQRGKGNSGRLRNSKRRSMGKSRIIQNRWIGERVESGQLPLEISIEETNLALKDSLVLLMT
jgi:hypothetical protein